MKNLLIAILVGSASLLKAQDKGINFEHGLSWAQIKEKAQKENKYIFVDGFTTWCGPCKQMAREVFPLPEVGKFFNAHFINVAVQFDKTKNDNQEIKSWYKDAEYLHKTYKITRYPTYLFLNPKGDLVQTATSYLKPDAFISLGKTVLDKFYLKKIDYLAGKKDTAAYLPMIQEALRAFDFEFASTVINDYLPSQKNLLTEQNLQFIDIATQKSTDPGFRVILDHSKEFDAVAGAGKSARKIGLIAYDEVVLPLVRKDGKKVSHGWGMSEYTGELNKQIDWQIIRSKLEAIYSQFAEDVMIDAKLQYYRETGDWTAYAGIVSNALKATGGMNNQRLDSYAHMILSSCQDKEIIGQALAWSDQTLQNTRRTEPFFLSTNAQLLYKSGNRARAVATMEEAIKLTPGDSEDMKKMLEKIKANKPTW